MSHLPHLRRPRLRWPAVALLVGAGCASAAGSAGAAGPPPVQPETSPPAVAAGCSQRVAAAGDMNSFSATQATGALAVSQHPDVVTVLGDQQYPDGSLADYRAEYDRTGWGALKARTRPVPGNHEYLTPGARGYFTYFGNPRPYYGYDLGCGWRGYALNSEIDISVQARWLRRDLAAHPRARVVAYWHQPRYSSGTEHGGEPAVQPFWDALGVRRGVVLNGHEHNYERFAVRRNLREFVAGTGGSATYPFGRPVAGSAKRIAGTPGVLVLTLRADGYLWRFLDRSGVTLDTGRG